MVGGARFRFGGAGRVPPTRVVGVLMLVLGVLGLPYSVLNSFGCDQTVTSSSQQQACNVDALAIVSAALVVLVLGIILLVHSRGGARADIVDDPESRGG